MRISDLIKMGLLNLWRRKGRTMLTILGVIIGSVSVVLMLSIALGSEMAVQKQVESFGNIRVINIRGEHTEYFKFYQEETEGSEAQPEKKEREDGKKKLNDESVKEIEQMAHVMSVVPFYFGNMGAKAGKLEASFQVMACDLEKLKDMGFKLGRGKLPKPGEKALITYPEMRRDFYDPNSRGMDWKESDVPVFGETLNMYFSGEWSKNGAKKSPLRYESVGETVDASEYGYRALMDVETFKTMVLNDIRRYGNINVYKKDKKKDLYNGIKVLVDGTDNVVKVTDELKAMGFEAMNQVEILEEMKKQTDIMKYVLGGIGAVALFVAAIGITNTMVMAIYERTREIGVMKVLGAEVLDILKLFLLEAALIGFIGGLIGLGFSYLGSHFINAAVATSEGFMADTDLSYIPFWLALSSIIFSTMIGVVSGIVPAIRATRLSALEAIKTQG